MYQVKYEYEVEDNNWVKDTYYTEDPDQWVKEMEEKAINYRIIYINPVTSRRPSVAKLYQLLDDKKIDPLDFAAQCLFELTEEQAKEILKVFEENN